MQTLLFPLVFVVSLMGCTAALETQPTVLRHLTVYYADADTINKMARSRGYQGPLVVHGLYDPVRHELWCPDGEDAHSLQVCGHELRHAVKGQFHQ